MATKLPKHIDEIERVGDVFVHLTPGFCFYDGGHCMGFDSVSEALGFCTLKSGNVTRCNCDECAAIVAKRGAQ